MPGRITGRTRPNNDPQWAREMEFRVGALEHGQASIRIKDWVISSDDAGELIATNSSGRHVTLTATVTTMAEQIVVESTTPPPGK